MDGPKDKLAFKKNHKNHKIITNMIKTKIDKELIEIIEEIEIKEVRKMDNNKDSVLEVNIIELQKFLQN
jgi:hypothetical protein